LDDLTISTCDIYSWWRPVY